MKIIGLTGGIGSGKSTAARFFEELGAVVYDLDKAGHDVLKKDSAAYKQVLGAFGEDITGKSGEIDRSRLGKIVFNKPAALKRLNSIMHPAIDKIVAENIRENRRQGIKVMVMEAAAMLEAERGWQADEVWVLTAPENEAIRRIKERPDYNEDIARSRIKSQMTNTERLKKATVVISNEGSVEELKEKIKVEWEKLQKRL